MVKQACPPSMPYWLLLSLLPALVFSGTAVKYLPGFDGPLPFELETGYVGVGESEEVQLFYYFIKSEGDPEKDPLMIWLSGGPGCSSLSGLVLEIGPLGFKSVEYKGGAPAMELFPDSWTKVASILFVDSPAETGFSYAKTTPASQSSDSKQAEQIHEFLRKWMMDHPELLSNPFYVGGDSYSGMVVPALTLKISTGNERGVKPFINLQGYVAGNPVTDASYDGNAAIPFAHGMALISDELYEALERSCKGEYQDVDPNNTECSRNLDAFSECTSKINFMDVLEELCEFPPVKPFYVRFGRRRYLKESLQTKLSLPAPDCNTYGYWMCEFWANDKSVRKALNIREGSIGRWMRCVYSIPYATDISSSFPIHLRLGNIGLRSLIYSGDHDMVVPFLGTQAWIRALNFSIVDDWRPWMIKGQVAGYTRTYSNQMTFATVKGGGHTAEYLRPPYSFMFKRWVKGEPL